MATPFGSFNASPLGGFVQSPLGARGGGVVPGTWVCCRVASPNHRVIVSETDPPASWSVQVNSGTTGAILFAVFAGRFIFQNFSSPIATPSSETNHSGLSGGQFVTGATPLIYNGVLWTANNASGSSKGLYYTTDGINYTLAMSNADWAAAAGVTGLSGYLDFGSPGQIYYLNGAYWTIGTYRRTVTAVLRTFFVVFTSSDGITWTTVGGTSLFQDYLGAVIYKNSYSSTYPKIGAYSTATALGRWEYSGGAWSNVSNAVVTDTIGGRIMPLGSRLVSLESGKYSDNEFGTNTTYSSAGFPRGLIIGNYVYLISGTYVQRSIDRASTFANHGVSIAETPTSFSNPNARYY